MSSLGLEVRGLAPLRQAWANACLQHHSDEAAPTLEAPVVDGRTNRLGGVPFIYGRAEGGRWQHALGWGRL